jgi:hypothetical protein
MGISGIIHGGNIKREEKVQQGSNESGGKR